MRDIIILQCIAYKRSGCAFLIQKPDCFNYMYQSGESFYTSTNILLTSG
ncbi:hypothetical protein KTG07_03510 [[Clostridium] innocuum]|nr:hypothetical protein [[Clostridium] innocuum]